MIKKGPRDGPETLFDDCRLPDGLCRIVTPGGVPSCEIYRTCAPLVAPVPSIAASATFPSAAGVDFAGSIFFESPDVNGLSETTIRVELAPLGDHSNVELEMTYSKKFVDSHRQVGTVLWSGLTDTPTVADTNIIDGPVDITVKQGASVIKKFVQIQDGDSISIPVTEQYPLEYTIELKPADVKDGAVGSRSILFDTSCVFDTSCCPRQNTLPALV